ncbi:MAG TPA: YceI family protein [Streptosporangiaceae bacterium]|nr:YceI family protein [Streptosporangiaceae bacterium]
MSADPAAVPEYIAGTWDIDAAHSHVGFVARHLMVSKVRGSFTKLEGEIITAENPLESSATATIQTDSLSTGNETRDGDVKGENFLDVANHPTMTYRSTGIRAEGDGYVVDGELTIKGITHPVELAVEVNGFGPDPYGGTRAGLSATGEINRNDYGITANLVLPTGGVMVSEKIQLTIEIEAALRKE